jgi:hypothetical protein
MKIGIVSPSKVISIKEICKNAEEIITILAKKLAEEGYEIVITPDKGSVSELFAQEYIKFNGKKVWEILPLEDTEFGYKEWVNTELGEAINCKIWRNQPEKFNEETDSLLVLGYSVGGLFEIGYSKWLKPKPIHIINELISTKLPEEINRSLKINYVSYKELKL